MNIVGLIPARGGSKGIPHKNLVDLAGRPLIAWSIDCALRCSALSRVVVSTDDELIAEVARREGADVPFLRPAELAGDAAGALGVMRHAVDKLELAGGERVDVLVYLQPTSPLRRSTVVNEVVEHLIRGGFDSVVTVVRVPHNFTPGSLMRDRGGVLEPLFSSDEAVLNRRDKPLLYARNGPAVLALVRAMPMEQGRLYGERTGFVEMGVAESVDIDDLEDLELARVLMAERLRQQAG